MPIDTPTPNFFLNAVSLNTPPPILQVIFFHLYYIHTVEPSGTIDVAVNTSTGELCLSLLPRGCFSTTKYNITVRDVTGYVVSKRLGIPDGQCTPIDILQLSDSKCAPFDIAIDGYNPVATYQTVYKTVGNSEFVHMHDIVLAIIMYEDMETISIVLHCV